ncbi:MAG TPA: hypothetical protein ENG87_02350 [Candidatus Pacearchaeota archaeon]|nr:hypothetical protein BMS3Abin17_00282 [archaeon BMS3Abin17]HDK42196.1 hypothetical protein [Candidatus Pacearchaeota archaeon]HDZ60363.1 hypothetical protein [Candidatus Pacearchaeota archaeon]
MRNISYLSELVSNCECIAINSPKSKFNNKNSYFCEGIPGYEFKEKDIEIHVALATQQTNSFDVVFKGGHVFSGLGADAIFDTNEADIKIYKKGKWENIIKKLSREFNCILD